VTTKVYFLDDATKTVRYLGVLGDIQFTPEAIAEARQVPQLPEGSFEIEVPVGERFMRTLRNLLNPPVVEAKVQDRSWERANDWRNKRRRFGR